MLFKVEEIISGDEIRISPNWAWQGEIGDTVVVYGYITPKPTMDGYEFAKKKLEKLILGRKVELYSPSFYDKFGHAKLVCNVYLDGIDISNFFPEFKSSKSRYLRGFEGE